MCIVKQCWQYLITARALITFSNRQMNRLKKQTKLIKIKERKAINYVKKYRYNQLIKWTNTPPN